MDLLDSMKVYVLTVEKGSLSAAAVAPVRPASPPRKQSQGERPR